MLVVIHSDKDQPDANLQEGHIGEFWKLQEEFGKYYNIATKDSQILQYFNSKSKLDVISDPLLQCVKLRANSATNKLWMNVNLDKIIKISNINIIAMLASN